MSMVGLTPTTGAGSDLEVFDDGHIAELKLILRTNSIFTSCEAACVEALYFFASITLFSAFIKGYNYSTI